MGLARPSPVTTQFFVRDSTHFGAVPKQGFQIGVNIKKKMVGFQSHDYYSEKCRYSKCIVCHEKPCTQCLLELNIP